jgi:hypothetical protein
MARSDVTARGDSSFPKDETAEFVAQLLDLLGIARGAEAFGQFPTLEREVHAIVRHYNRAALFRDSGATL